jgi:NitT/TauT family transport system ATP-binding protein
MKGFAALSDAQTPNPRMIEGEYVTGTAVDGKQGHFIEVEGISHTFGDGVQALANVSFTISAGAFVAVVGASGVGKSTLLRILAGLLLPSSGRVLLAGRPPPHPDFPVGVVFQRYNLMPWRTVHDNIRLPLELQGHRRGEAELPVNQLISLVGLSGFENSYPAQLSGGMAQRVALARALVHRPAFLLLDEPFGALDALTRERMGQELLRIWQALPVTVFMVTHSIPEAVFLADEVLVMNGRPGTVTSRVPVRLPRPRRLQEEAGPVFQECVAAIRQAIHE